MCLTAPAHILEVDGDEAVIELAGRVRRASLLLLPDVRPGDEVLVGAGRVIRRLESGEAEELERLLAPVAGLPPFGSSPSISTRGASS
jgi:hydrogenase expression/formation protein HypC